MPLRTLTETPEGTAYQETAFSTDVYGRFLCSTWDEAVHDNPPPDVVVLGAGTYGAYCAAKLAGRGRRVLLLDAGSVVVPEHIQNLGTIGLRIPRGDPDPTGVWRLPWRSNVYFPGLAFCAGGRSMYTGGWLARLSAEDLSTWPKEVVADLEAGYPRVEAETGVEPAWDFVNGNLHTTLLPLLREAATRSPGLLAHTVRTAPLAVQAAPSEFGLFPFRKFSTLPVLLDAVRNDKARADGRRLHFVPRATALKLWHGNGFVRALDVALTGRRERLPIPQRCAVVLALGTIESTRLALNSFPTAPMGRNLMIHTRSDFIARVHRSALPGLGELRLDVATVLARGAADTGRYHLQITATSGAGGADDPLFRMVPDLDHLDQIRDEADPEWVTLVIRAVGETHGEPDTPVGTAGGTWIGVDPDDPDPFHVPRAFVSVHLRPSDLDTWRGMDAASVGLLRALVPDPEKIRYWHDGRWRRTPFPLTGVDFPSYHNPLGSSQHEAGALRMGEDPRTSVTDPAGRFHHLRNAYACDASVFPTVGSAGPMLTGLTLARRLAERL